MAPTHSLRAAGRSKLFAVLIGTFAVYTIGSAIFLFSSTTHDTSSHERIDTFIAVPKQPLASLRSDAFMAGGVAILRGEAVDDHAYLDGDVEDQRQAPVESGSGRVKPWWQCGENGVKRVPESNATGSSKAQEPAKRLVYTRIPKTGSSHFVHMLEELAFELHFRCDDLQL